MNVKMAVKAPKSLYRNLGLRGEYLITDVTAENTTKTTAFEIVGLINELEILNFNCDGIADIFDFYPSDKTKIGSIMWGEDTWRITE